MRIDPINEQLKASSEELQKEVIERERFQEELNQFFELSIDVFGIVGFDGSIKRINSVLPKTLGYTEEELLSRSTAGTLSDLIHPEDRAATAAAFRDSLRGKNILNFENRYRCVDGSYRWFSWNARSSVERCLIYVTARDITHQKSCHDLTNRKQMEEELRESEERYRRIVETANEGIWALDAENRTVFVNRKMAEMLGCTIEEMLGRSLFEFVDEEWRAAAKASVERRRRGAVEQYDRKYRRKDGTGLWSIVSTSPTYDKEGKYIGALVMATDITERKRMEEELRKHHDHLEKLVKECTTKLKKANKLLEKDIIERKRIEGELRYRVEFENLMTTISINFINLAPQDIDNEINHALGKIGEFTGVDRSYILLFSDNGTKLANTNEWCASGIEPQLSNLKEFIISAIPWAAGKFSRFENLYVPSVADLQPAACAEREHFPAQDIQSLVCVPMVYDKALMGILGFDFARAKKAWLKEIIASFKVAGNIFVSALERKRLEEESERYKILSKYARDIILFISCDGQIIEANNAAISAYGYGREELLTKHIYDLRAPKTLSLVERQMGQADLEGILFESIHRRKDGRAFPVEVSSQGALIGSERVLLSVIRDITERKRAEEELFEARKKAERAERMASLGTMAVSIAHEINQPLNSIYLLVNGLLYWYEKGNALDAGEVIEELEKISAQAERINAIIRRMRSFVRSKHPIKLTPCNLNNAVEIALEMIGSLLSSHGIKLKKSLQDALPAVLGENLRLEEVVVNLLVNAMHALNGTDKKEKVISIATRAGKKVILEISDNATGINKKIKNKIFDPFFTTKGVGVGMGLGLSIVHSIVTSFNGKIHVEANEMGGATFRVEFPVLKKER